MYGLKPGEIHVGQQYQLEEKYYYVATVTILADECGTNEEKLRGATWVGWKVRVDENLGGMSPIASGKEFSVGWDTEFPHYNSAKFKPVGSAPDYVSLPLKQPE